MLFLQKLGENTAVFGRNLSVSELKTIIVPSGPLLYRQCKLLLKLQKWFSSVQPSVALDIELLEYRDIVNGVKYCTLDAHHVMIYHLC